MGTIFVNDGDIVVYQRREFVMENGTLVARNLCRACNERVPEFESEYGNLCARCVTTAMEGYVLQQVLNHLIENDDAITEVMHIMARVDLDASRRSIPHVDFHSASFDMAWSADEDEWMQIVMHWASSIRAVLDARTLIARP